MDREILELIENLDELIAPPQQKLDDETLICECFCVNVRDIRELCSTSVDLDLLKDQLNLGGGCQSCLKNKDSWIDKIF
jgi:NAD(P)H-nitrite reductase large subunit